MEFLKSCPFCGGKANKVTLVDEANFGGDVIVCSQCDACSRVVFGEKEGLTDYWNRRTEQAATVPDGVIREVFMRNGFTIKEGQTDLKPYVYAAARELLSMAAPAEADRRDAERYRGLRDLASKARAEWEIEGKQYGLMLGAEPYEIDELVDAALAKGEVAE